MLSFIATWFVTSIAVFFAVSFIPGLSVTGGAVMSPILAALMLSLINASLKPIIKFLSLPLTVLTLGLFSLVVNALMLELAGWLSRTVFGSGIFVANFWAALLGSIVISLVTTVVGYATGTHTLD